ncbi:S-layer homology domain-containing protein [Arthrobacter sp. TMT4-20]
MTEGPPEKGKEPRHRQAVNEPFVQTLKRSSVPFRFLALLVVVLLIAGSVSVYSAVRADGVELPTDGVPAGVTTVSLTFDDGYADQVEASRIMDRHNFKGTFYVSTGLIAPEEPVGDEPARFMTLSEIRELRDNGHEIGGHTVTHVELPTPDLAEMTREVCDDRTILTNYGFKVTSFAFPYASTSTEAQQVAEDCGYNSARGLGGLQSPDVPGAIGSCENCEFSETTPPDNPYLIKAPRQVENTWTLEDLKGTVTNAEADGGWVPLSFHHVNKSDSLIAIDPEIFETFIDWLADRAESGALVVRTVDQVIGGAEQPAVRGPLPEARTGNMILNAGFETMGPNDETPDCWQTGGWGDNSPSFSVVGDARTGEQAQRLIMRSHVDGDAKLLPKLDLGACAPTVRTGLTYDLSAWYKSTGNTQFEIYTRSALGPWNHWTSSPYSPPAEDWEQARFTTPPIPHGVVELSFGMNLLDDGRLVTDDYGMQPTPGASNGQRAPQAQAFTDYPASGLFYTEVQWLAREGITIGYADGTFRPLEPMDRKTVAAFLYRMAGEPTWEAPTISPFTDVSPEDEHYLEITWLASRGIASGWTDGTFRPQDPITRNAVAAFLHRFGGSPEVTPIEPPFTDVTEESPHYEAIVWLASQGIAASGEEQTYRPSDRVNRDAMAGFLHRYDRKFGTTTPTVATCWTPCLM